MVEKGNIEAANEPRHVKWHYVYYVLAAFDVITISFSLFLNHQIMGIYTRSVVLNQEWASRSAHYSELGELATAVNAPGNDVFDTKNVEAESAKLDEALSAFTQSLTLAIDDLRSNAEIESRPSQLGPRCR